MQVKACHTSDHEQFDLRLGPLHYRFVADDAWGHSHLLAMTRHLQAISPAKHPDRIVRLAREARPRSSVGWHIDCTPLGTIRHHSDTPTAAWTATASPELPVFNYHLPWSLIIADMTARDGAVIHAGLAVRNHRGLLFLAPSGGGKSTTLASAPSDWMVLSDDAALVWPEDGAWQASPLPSWTMMTTPIPAGASAWRFDLGANCRIHGLVVLAKEPAVSLTRLTPIDAAPPLFRALNEYPSTVLVDPPLKGHFFRGACALTRALPCWRLGLPLGGDIWPRLSALVEGRP